MTETEHMAVNGRRPPRDRSRGGRALAAERRIRALELRKAGANYRDIAATLEVSVGQAFADVRKSMSKLSEFEAEQAEDVRRLTLERLDGILAGHYIRAVQGCHRSALIVLKVIERQAKLLALDEPERHGDRRSDLGLYLHAKYGIRLDAPATSTAVGLLA